MYSNRVFLIQLSDTHAHARTLSLSLSLGHYLWSYSIPYAAIITALPIIRALQLPIIILLCFLWGPFLFNRKKKGGKKQREKGRRERSKDSNLKVFMRPARWDETQRKPKFPFEAAAHGTLTEETKERFNEFDSLGKPPWARMVLA